MKHRLIAALLTLGLTMPSEAIAIMPAPPPPNFRLALDLIDAMGVEAAFNNEASELRREVEADLTAEFMKRSPEVPSDLSANTYRQCLHERVRQEVAQLMPLHMASAKEALATGYAKALSADALKAATLFYRTPAGREYATFIVNNDQRIQNVFVSAASPLYPKLPEMFAQVMNALQTNVRTGNLTNPCR